jgi:hypothetical protein
MSDRMTTRTASSCFFDRATSSPGLALTLAAGLGLASPLGCKGRGSGQDGANPAANTAGSRETDGADSKAVERFEIDLFAFGRQLGTIAPCGCTTDPLGGLQYAFGYIEAHSDPGQRLILEPGSFLYPDPEGAEAPVDEAAWAQAQQRAALLQGRFSEFDGLVSGLGPTDLASGEGPAALSSLPLPRVIANLEAGVSVATVEAHRVVALGHGLTAAVTQVVDPELGRAARAKPWGKDFPELRDPLAALTELAPALEAAANLQIVMVHGPRELAEQIAREVPGVDVVIMGGVIDNPERGRLGSVPVRIGEAWLLEPGDRGQTIAHLTLAIDVGVATTERSGGFPGDWAVVPAKSQRVAELARVEDKLGKFRDDPSADPAFIQRLEADRDRLQAELDDPSLPEAPVVVIPEQVKVTCRLEVDEGAKQALSNYDAQVAEQNRERFAGVRPPAPAAGEAGYVGIDACADCHSEAVELWQDTAHGSAYATLVTANKQFDLSCVGCHVTGFREPGGSEVVENHHLQSVQCEQCHGPGSLHVEDPSPTNIRLEVPSDVCEGCHTPEHSDTFEYQAYLRDVLGTGHGADARTKLGEGPTGRELRAAGLAEAGGCPKM